MFETRVDSRSSCRCHAPRMVTDPDCFQASDEAAYMAGAQKKLNKAMKCIEKAVCAASRAVQCCAGLKKLTEALDHLDIKERYDLNAPALDPSPSIAKVSTVFVSFGVSLASRTTRRSGHSRTPAFIPRHGLHTCNHTPRTLRVNGVRP